MRKQGKILKHISNVAFRDGYIDASVGFEELPAGDDDASRIRPREPRNAVQERSFSGAGCAKQNVDPWLNDEINIKFERRGQLLSQRNHQRVGPEMRLTGPAAVLNFRGLCHERGHSVQLLRLVE